MKIDILTIFPNMFKGPFDESIVKRAQNKGLVEIKTHNLRKWAEDKHKTVDDRPFGGGTGMIFMIQPIDEALESLKLKMQNAKCPPAKDWHCRAGKITIKNSKLKQKIILLTPRGKLFNQKIAHQLSKLKHLILVCGHYEGVDERVRKLVDEEISIGDYVLTGGELPAMVLVDTVVRLIPGVLEKTEAIANESFSNFQFSIFNFQLLEYPQYTRPANYKGWKVPQVLLSGNHGQIEKWRQKKALEFTKQKRPDLIFTPEVEASRDKKDF